MRLALVACAALLLAAAFFLGWLQHRAVTGLMDAQERERLRVD